MSSADLTSHMQTSWLAVSPLCHLQSSSVESLIVTQRLRLYWISWRAGTKLAPAQVFRINSVLWTELLAGWWTCTWLSAGLQSALPFFFFTMLSEHILHSWGLIVMLRAYSRLLSLFFYILNLSHYYKSNLLIHVSYLKCSTCHFFHCGVSVKTKHKMVAKVTVVFRHYSAEFWHI